MKPPSVMKLSPDIYSKKESRLAPCRMFIDLTRMF